MRTFPTPAGHVVDVAQLPEISRRVYVALVAGLYAEPGFSDVEVTDIAKATDLTTRQVRGALKKLHEEGFVFTDDGSGCGTFLYPLFWDSQNPEAEATRDLIAHSGD